jgi:hypothetical protein
VTDDPQKPEEAGAKLKEWFLKTAGAIVGAIGLAGSMVVVGSAVLWVRFKEAGIPALQAVSVQPEHEALVQGAETTIWFALAALAAVAVLYVVDSAEIAADKDGKRVDSKGQAAKEPADDHEMGKGITVALCALAGAGLLWAFLHTKLGVSSVVFLLVLAPALAYGCYWMARSDSKNFWALAGVVFVAVVVFSGVVTYLTVKEQKFAQAVAVLRGKEDTGLSGLYVAAEDEKLYLATPLGAGGGRSGDKAIQKVSMGEGSSYSVGPPEPVAAAERSSEAMLRQLVANREGATAVGQALPAWLSDDVAATFSGKVEAHEEVADEPLCLMRFAEASQKDKKRSFWTSCAEAEALATIHTARERLALPGRFQKLYEIRVKVEVPSGTKLHYAEGDTAPQCAGGPGEPCGHRYPGGGIQYWIEQPSQLGEVSEECSKSLPDQESAWEPCT